MGKVDDRQLPVAQHQQSPPPLRRRCRLINFKCAVVFTLTVAAFVSALFCALPSRHRQAGFDATESIKLTATVQAYFRLHKPVSKLIQQIARLEYDLNEEIGVPSSKVAILSMHQDGKSNWSDVVFGFLPDPIDISTNPVFLSLLRSSLTDLFFQQCNLTLNYSLFGDPSSFEILKFPGGITMIPERPAFLMHVPEALFCFSLDSSIHDIKENILELKEQLNSGLHLLPNEVVYIQVTSDHGTTKDPPVTVKASVLSGVGALPQERLKELAHIITGPAENLGLNHSVFGEVKEISLSSFLNLSLRAQTPIPSPSPAPSRGQLYGTGSSPTSSPPDVRRSIPPCSNCYASTPTAASDFIPPTPHSLPIADSPESSEINGSPHCGSPDPSVSPSATYFNQVSPSASPSVRSGPDSRCKGM
ncbi:uncharacterized protein LOC131019170 [Salvia miltiorrhiza]|uniref:uncharacterized protein LOC131019170 n=1 Tax=Salvia miltiorrhiza TaxID=226208 RepID=UPI0025AC6869|nr:uncharacterized protein LOC131019170 [Salvia miltiorrhiza]